MSSKGVKNKVTWAKVAKLPWGPPEGLPAGGECFAPLRKVEEPPLGSLAAAADLEESASHHFMIFKKTCRYFNIPRKIQEPS